jgi:hypothetical protein
VGSRGGGVKVGDISMLRELVGADVREIWFAVPPHAVITTNTNIKMKNV